MIALRKWILSLAGTALACVVAYQFLDRPIALVFHKTVAHPEPFAKLTHLPHALCAAGSHYFRRLRPLEPLRPRAVANSELRSALQHQPHRRRDDQSAAQICVRKDMARYLDL